MFENMPIGKILGMLFPYGLNEPNYIRAYFGKAIF
jgi:hypothetical protein